jgi:hypothetical protein
VETSKTYGLIKKHAAKLTALIIALYALPSTLTRPLSYSLDGSWAVAVNNAVKKGLVFGQDFIFAYGPLGYLSTRYSEYISPISLLLADIFLFAGVYHFTYKYITPKKAWWLILTLICVLMLRSTIYSQSLFLLFILYTALNFKNKPTHYFELGYCSIAAILLFFIKINYGIISLALLLLLALTLLFKEPKKFVFLITFSAAAFACFYFSLHVGLVGYIRYSLPLMSHYDEAMHMVKDPLQTPFLAALVLLALLFSVLVAHLALHLKTKTLRPIQVFSTCCILLAAFLFYKNGFTRPDHYHYGEFFATFSFFMLTAIFITQMQRYLLSKLAMVAAIIICGYNLMLPDINDKSVNMPYYLSYLSPTSYFQSIFKKEKNREEPIRVLAEDKLKLIGNATVDILPWEINLTHYYNLNYHPRPIPQSPAYAPILDSLNANHFYKPTRPEIVMHQNFPIDYHYCFWDESLTKAVIRLNYNYIDFAAVNGGHRLEDEPFDTYLLLRSKKTPPQYPAFQKLSSREVRMDDTIQINFPADQAIYMSPEFKYSPAGSISRLLYQVPSLNVILFFDDSTHHEYRAVVPIVAGPVLINKAVLKNIDLKNFYTGELAKNRNITAFSFHPTTSGFEPVYRITFMKFSNY